MPAAIANTAIRVKADAGRMLVSRGIRCSSTAIMGHKSVFIQ
jgi:hypothetical protein